MTEPVVVDQSVTARRRSMAFRKRQLGSLPTREQSRREGDLLRAAWRHFGETAPIIAFLNTHQSALEGKPLQLAIESDDGLERVERLLQQLTREA